jgi:hypothetical protein
MPLLHPEQNIQKALAAHDQMRAAGSEIAVIDAALAQLEGWGLLRGQTK